MSFRPDIIVTSGDPAEVFLAVVANLGAFQPQEFDAAMGRYLQGTNCPVGLAVSPDQMVVYRNQYRPSPEQTVERIGSYANDVVEFAMVGRSFDSEEHFASFVQSWLESLALSGEINSASSELREVFAAHVLPYLTVGQVRPTGPRAPALRHP